MCGGDENGAQSFLATTRIMRMGVPGETISKFNLYQAEGMVQFSLYLVGRTLRVSRGCYSGAGLRPALGLHAIGAACHGASPGPFCSLSTLVRGQNKRRMNLEIRNLGMIREEDIFSMLWKTG